MSTPRRYELTDFEWSIIQPLLPNKPRGMPRVDDRKVLNGIYWRLRTGSPWADIPERYGPPTTCANRFRRWAKIGVWDRIFAAVSTGLRRRPADDRRLLDPGSPAWRRTLKRGSAATPPPLGTDLSPLHGALARRADHQDPRPCRCQRPAGRLKLTEGQAHDGRSAADMLAPQRRPDPDRRPRLRQRPSPPNT